MTGVKLVVNDVIKSDGDKRLYRGMELDNEMLVLLISDSTTDKSSAAMDVHIGNYIFFFMTSYYNDVHNILS